MSSSAFRLRQEENSRFKTGKGHLERTDNDFVSFGIAFSQVVKEWDEILTVLAWKLGGLHLLRELHWRSLSHIQDVMMLGSASSEFA